jgi:hypothetical protein
MTALRWPDGTFVHQMTAPAEQAAQLERESPGWTVWWGAWTGQFWAATRPATGIPLLIEGRTASELAQRMDAGAAWAVAMRA